MNSVPNVNSIRSLPKMCSQSSIYCKFYYYRFHCSNCGSIYSKKNEVFETNKPKLCHFVIYCSPKKFRFTLYVKLGYCELPNKLYSLWTVMPFAMHARVKRASYTISLWLRFCSMLCLSSSDGMEHMHWNIIQVYTSTFNAHVNMSLFKRASQIEFTSNEIRLPVILICRSEYSTVVLEICVPFLNWKSNSSASMEISRMYIILCRRYTSHRRIEFHLKYI